jgi:CRP-like cAMP-binding protein
MSTRDRPASASLDIILFLKDVALFESLSSSQLAEVARLAERVDVPEGRSLVNQGEPADCLYLIRRGKVRVITNGQEVARLGTGECTGEMAVLAGTERTATTETLEPCQLLRFDADDFLALLDTYPEIQRALLKSMVMRLAQSGRTKDNKRASTIIGMVWGKDGPVEKPPPDGQ